MAFTEKQPEKWPSIRRTLRILHLWMGIGSGIILFIVCLTGTIHTFSDEINKALNSELYSTTPSNTGQSALSPEEILQKFKDQQAGEKISSVNIPHEPSVNWMVSASLADKKEGGGRGTTYLVNPYTGEVKGTNQTGSSEFFLTIMKLHRWLLLDTETGRPIVGIATIIFCLLVMSGLVIWIPAKAKMWRQGLKMKWNAGWKRRNHDLHNTLGFYAAIPLLVMGLTGLTWSFEWYNDGLRKMLGTYKPKGAPREEVIRILPAADNAAALPIAQLITITDQQFAYKGNYRITLPGSKDQPIVISKTKTGFFAPAAGDKITIHPYNGEILKKDVFSTKPFGERISGSIKALHVGNVYGGFTKFLYLICCLIATSLPVTGTIIWINKLKKNRKPTPLARLNSGKVYLPESQYSIKSL